MSEILTEPGPMQRSAPPSPSSSPSPSPPPGPSSSRSPSPSPSPSPGAALDWIGELTAQQLLSMPIGEVAQVSDALAAVRRALGTYEGLVHRALDQRFALRAQALRLAAGKTTGTVRLHEDGTAVVATLPKKPCYDQIRLKEAVARLQADGHDPAEYVEISYQVSELRYQAWPAAIRAHFDAARTVKAGKATYSFEPIRPAGTEASNDARFAAPPEADQACGAHTFDPLS